MSKPKANRQASITFNYFILWLVAAACLIPFLLVISISVSGMSSIYDHGYSFFPVEFSFDAYSYIFQNSERIIKAYGVSAMVTVAGAVLSLTVLAMIAYPLSRREYRWNRPIAFLVFFTMLFNGGLVPWYIMITRFLHLKDTIWVLILPYVVVPFFVLLLRTFFMQLPGEVLEAAKVDGCSEYRIFFHIVLPVSMPALATVGLLCALRYWNDWWLGLLFIDSQELVPLQLLLHTVMSNIQELAKDAAIGGFASQVDFPSESARMAMAVIAAGPMMFIFMFFQKYFVKGITVGSIKG